MDKINLKVRAKINFALDVKSRRPDGYHEVEMIMQQIDLYDQLELEVIDEGIVIETNCDFLPVDAGNIAYRAAEKMIANYNINKGLKIIIEKNIPVSAGLAGGSTNAAGVIMGMNELFSLGLTRDEMMVIGGELGADVPFCILGGCAVARGIGEELESISGLKDQWILLSKPNIGVSTKEAYEGLELGEISERPDIDAMVEAIGQNDIYDLAKHLCNVFETYTLEKYPVVKEVRRKIQESGAVGVLMSGTGPTVFGIFKSYDKGLQAYKNLKKVYSQTYLVKTYNGGHSDGE